MKNFGTIALLMFPFLAFAGLTEDQEAAKEAFLRSEKAAYTYLDQVQATLIIDHPELLNPVPEAAKESERPESNPSSPPLQTDDTGTPGPGGIELNTTMSCDRSSVSKSCERLIDVNFGVGEKLQIKVERAYQVQHGPDGDSSRGMGPTDIGLKYRFYDRKGFSAAIYPTVTVDNSSRRDSQGEKMESGGNAIYIPLILSKDIGNYTVVTNTGYRRSFKDRDDDSIIGGISVGKAINETTRVMGEVFSERDRNFHNRRTDVRVGFIKIVTPNSAKFQTSVYASLGRSVGRTEDGVPHTTLQFGLSIVKKPGS